MGADMIALGWTLGGPVPAERPKPDEWAARMVEQFESTLKLVQWDEPGWLDFDEGDLYLDGVKPMLQKGLQLLAEGGPYRETASFRFTVEGAERHFVMAGGMSWGDSPFDGFDDLCVAFEALDHIPALARSARETYGILGDGIVTATLEELAAAHR